MATKDTCELSMAWRVKPLQGQRQGQCEEVGQINGDLHLPVPQLLEQQLLGFAICIPGGCLEVAW